jgi:signal transduction histidine kinase
MKFSVFAVRISDRPELETELESIVEQARRAIMEGRDAVQDLRSSTLVANDLARAIGVVGSELASSQTSGIPPAFSARIQGTSRELYPLVRDEVYRIACEALRNAFQHAQATRIEVEVCYESRHFQLLVRDDGRGINQEVLDEGGRPGHHGLRGIQERAHLVGGKLSVLSRLNSGTSIDVTIPGSIAYTKSSPSRRSRISGKATG